MSEKRSFTPDEELVSTPEHEARPSPKPDEPQHLKPEEESAELLERSLHEKKLSSAMDLMANDPLVYRTPR
ncbi:MAG: hypothetical protein IAE79_05625 [Anaerolinea sp.]|nr:hypothetical protein [Anaerolinea sp.]